MLDGQAKSCLEARQDNLITQNERYLQQPYESGLTLALAILAISPKASISRTAISASTLRSISTLALAKPLIKRL